MLVWPVFPGDRGLEEAGPALLPRGKTKDDGGWGQSLLPTVRSRGDVGKRVISLERAGRAREDKPESQASKPNAGIKDLETPKEGTMGADERGFLGFWSQCLDSFLLPQ